MKGRSTCFGRRECTSNRRNFYWDQRHWNPGTTKRQCCTKREEKEEAEESEPEKRKEKDKEAEKAKGCPR